MGALLKYEWKAGIKALLIWSLAVGVMGMLCIVLYKSMEESMAGVAENFASMGAFSDAMGMSTLSIATLKGYFATEIGTVHSLGSSLFAASIATVILSKEEDGHTAEFTYTYEVTQADIDAGIQSESGGSEIYFRCDASHDLYRGLRPAISGGNFIGRRAGAGKGIPDFYGVSAADEY